MILLECIEKYDDGNEHCSSVIKLGDIVALRSVDRLDYNKTDSFVNVRLRNSTAWPRGVQQGEKLSRFRFIPASQHAQALNPNRSK